MLICFFAGVAMSLWSFAWCDRERALTVAERLTKAVAEHDFHLENQKVTISIGVGEYCLGESLEQLITHVDDALLIAKAKGKNRVELSSHSGKS
mgnify:CR=1 FL=1